MGFGSVAQPAVGNHDDAACPCLGGGAEGRHQTRFPVEWRVRQRIPTHVSRYRLTEQPDAGEARGRIGRQAPQVGAAFGDGARHAVRGVDQGDLNTTTIIVARHRQRGVEEDQPGEQQRRPTENRHPTATGHRFLAGTNPPEDVSDDGTGAGGEKKPLECGHLDPNWNLSSESNPNGVTMPRQAPRRKRTPSSGRRLCPGRDLQKSAPRRSMAQPEADVLPL